MFVIFMFFKLYIMFLFAFLFCPQIIVVFAPYQFLRPVVVERSRRLTAIISRR